MLDYKLVEALGKVVQEGGFERAAKALFVTQSAVSQRIRLLEDQCGQLLLTRSSPPQPTGAGKAILKHYQQVSLLEQGLKREMQPAAGDPLPTLPLGINADSLAFWFVDAIDPIFETMNVLLDLRVDDQEQTHHYLREGDVVGCISDESRPMQGCRVDLLGIMHYRLLASPRFVERWFPDGLTEQAIEQTPAVLFNRKDRLHHQFLSRYLDWPGDTFPAHYFPAPEAFVQLIVRGYSYGMVPDWQGRTLLDEGKLIELVPGATVTVKLFWHCWNLRTDLLDKLSRQLVEAAQKLLK